MDIDEFNEVMQSTDIPAALSHPLSRSYVVAEDSGLYPDRRLPSTYGLNFNIDKVNIKSVIALNQRTRSANSIEGDLTIVEPYGLSLVDALVAASFDIKSKQFNTWTDRPYLLELNFKGFDDAGEPIPASLANLYRKRFPIKITEMDIAHNSGKGTEYKLTFVNAGWTAFDINYGTTPCDITVTAGTVDEFFNTKYKNSFTSKLNDYYTGLVLSRTADFADVYKFDIDKAIAQSKIVQRDTATFAQSAAAATANVTATNAGINLDQMVFTIKAKTPIIDIITRVMSRAEFFIQNQLKLIKGDATGNQAEIFNAFRTTSDVKYGGANADGSIVEGSSSFDNRRNTFAQRFTYKIHQYATWSGKHPNLPLFSDSVPYSCKVYNYSYTGQNLDITDLKITFKNTYFTPALTFNDVFPATQTTKDTLIEATQALNPKIELNPNLLSRIYAQIGAVATVTPMKIVPTVNKPNITRGFGILSSPGAQVGADVFDTLYTRNTGDMATLDITILGDPTLIKQDGWLYMASPTEDAEYNKWVSQNQYANKNGSLRMDTGEIPVIININTILDMDTEYGQLNKGLGFPDPSNSQSSSVWSGQYQLNSVESTFEKGVFKQRLVLIRYPNQDYIASYQKKSGTTRSTGAVDINRLSQTATASVNGTVLGNSGTVIKPGRN
jgi:hypothetical protein